jgi:hypothetical protein
VGSLDWPLCPRTHRVLSEQSSEQIITSLHHVDERLYCDREREREREREHERESTREVCWRNAAA